MGRRKTPLFLDSSAEQVARTFFSYKARLEDVSMLTIPAAKRQETVAQLKERLRKGLVGALKSGQLFVFNMGELGIEHCTFKNKICNKTEFPMQTFQDGGKALMGPSHAPRYRGLYREEDLEDGEVRRDLCICILYLYLYLCIDIKRWIRLPSIP